MPIRSPPRVPDLRFWGRLVRGESRLRSRFHDYAGNFVGWGGLRFLPQAVVSSALFRWFGYRPPVPWLGYRATRRLEQLIGPEVRVLEFGAGASTLWFARHQAWVTSIESDPQWFERVRTMLESFSHIDLRLLSFPEYCDPPDLADGSFDLVLVDGLVRDRCMPTALRKVRTGGYAFLDNSDSPTAEHRRALDLLLAAAESPDDVEHFVDFYPTFVGVNRGTPVRVGRPNQPHR